MVWILDSQSWWLWWEQFQIFANSSHSQVKWIHVTFYLKLNLNALKHIYMNEMKPEICIENYFHCWIRVFGESFEGNWIFSRFILSLKVHNPIQRSPETCSSFHIYVTLTLFCFGSTQKFAAQYRAISRPSITSIHSLSDINVFWVKFTARDHRSASIITF
jgi:hypothetical protein